MKNILAKTTLICAISMIGASAFAVDGLTLINQGSYAPGLLDNSNFVEARKMRAEQKEYIETKDPAYVEEEVRQKMDLLNTEQVSFKLKDIKITGNTVFPTYVLMRLIYFKLGQQVTINDLIVSANDITDYYFRVTSRSSVTRK